MGTSTSSDTRVPFLDLRSVNEPIKERVLEAVAALIDSGAFTNGPEVAAFEGALAEYCGRLHCVGVASGLDALRLALIGAGLEAGESVVVPAATFVASFEAIAQAGGVPLPVDATESDYNLDMVATTGALAQGTRFVLPVHLYGQLTDMRSLLRASAARGVIVIEDACQAHGAERDGLRAGAGLAAAFSFYPGKNLGAFGDAGALVTDDPALAQTVRALREHGQRQKYRHELEGWTARLDTIQAIVLLEKLRMLDTCNNERRAAASWYNEGLSGVGDLRLPPVPPGSSPVWHLYPVRTKRPEALIEYLRERGIGSGRHYPEPPHLSVAYRRLGYAPGDFPVAEAIAAETVSLPIFPGITETQLDAVVGAVTDYFRAVG